MPLRKWCSKCRDYKETTSSKCPQCSEHFSTSPLGHGWDCSCRGCSWNGGA